MFYTKIKFERITAPTGYVEFSRDPQVPGYKRITQFMQPKDFSDGGDLYVYDKGLGPNRYRTLTFPDISENDLANFMTFFEDVAVGSKNLFLFTDRDGSVHVARIMNSDNIESTPQLANREALTIELLIDEEMDEYDEY